MKKILDQIKAEPALFYGLIQAGLAMGMSFGLTMTTEQFGMVMAFTAAALAFATRSQVTPNHIVAQKVDVALNTPVPQPDKPKE